MNRCLLYILFVAIVPVGLHGAQTDTATIETEITPHDNCVYFYRSANMYPKELLTRKQLEARCNKLLQNRMLIEEAESTCRQEPFLQQKYIWEKIGKPNHPEEYLRTKLGNGRIRWHQIHVDNTPAEPSYPQHNAPTVEQLKAGKKQLFTKSHQLRQKYEAALAQQRALLSQETLNIVKPVAALVQINKCERQHELYLKHCQKRSDDLKATDRGLRTKIPLDIQEYLKKNPEAWNSLKMLANLEEQEAELNQEKMCRQDDYASLQQNKLQEQERLQNAWLAFDQVAMSNAALAQRALAEKRQRIVNTHPGNPYINTTEIELTNEEVAKYICDYKIKTVLANVISKDEHDILASTYPTAIPPCIQGAHAQQLYLHDPEIALIEAAKKILLQNALDSKRKALIEQDPAIMATSIRLTQEEIGECLRIWNISQMLKQITTEKQLKNITDRFPQYTLKIIAKDAIKPKEPEDQNDQEVLVLDNGEQNISPNDSTSIQTHESTQTTCSNSWGIGSFISWG